MKTQNFVTPFSTDPVYLLCGMLERLNMQTEPTAESSLSPAFWMSLTYLPNGTPCVSTSFTLVNRMPIGHKCVVNFANTWQASADNTKIKTSDNQFSYYVWSAVYSRTSSIMTVYALTDSSIANHQKKSLRGYQYSHYKQAISRTKPLRAITTPYY